MILAEDIEPYISEPDNIYDLAGNCFGLLSADCQPKRTPVPYSADSLRHN